MPAPSRCSKLARVPIDRARVIISTALIFWGLIVLVLIYGVIVFNNLVRIKHNVSMAWSNIDVLLKQRHDELPKLVAACRQFKQFEQDTLQRVIEARGRVEAASQSQDVAALG